MPFGRSLLQKKSLLRVSGEERSPEILISFHSSGSTSNQWRKLKNPWFPGRTLFRPSNFLTGKKKRFFAQLAHSAGPTCISYLAGVIPEKFLFQFLKVINYISVLPHYSISKMYPKYFSPSTIYFLNSILLQRILFSLYFIYKTIL